MLSVASNAVKEGMEDLPRHQVLQRAVFIHFFRVLFSAFLGLAVVNLPPQQGQQKMRANPPALRTANQPQAESKGAFLHFYAECADVVFSIVTPCESRAAFSVDQPTSKSEVPFGTIIKAGTAFKRGEKNTGP